MNSTLTETMPAVRAAKSHDASDCAERLNRFLCDEIAAGVTYGMTADRLADSNDSPYLGLLRQLQEDHELAAESLRAELRELGGEVSDAAGVLGAWSGAARSVASLFSEDGDGASALQYLRDAELHVLEEYCTAVGACETGSAQLLHNLLIPTQRRHVRVLNELLG